MDKVEMNKLLNEAKTGENTTREWKVTKLDKFKENLYIKYNGEYGKIYSYNTLVGLIDYKSRRIWRTYWTIEMFGKKISSSPTTSKHINYVADELNSGMFMAMASETKDHDFLIETLGTYPQWTIEQLKETTLTINYDICKCDLINLGIQYKW